MNQLFIDKLHEAKTEKNAKLLEAVEQMYIVCEQKAQLESKFGDAAKKFGKAALLTGAVLGGSQMVDKALSKGMQARGEAYKNHAIACGDMMAPGAADKQVLNYDINDPAPYGVFDAIQNTIVNLQKTGKVGGYELAEDIYQLYKEVADGAPESVHKELLAKLAQGNDFVKSETTGVCNDGLPI